MSMIENVEVTGEYVTLDGELYFRIGNSHRMPDFFMSLVGASDHWMFVSSNGALTAGRQNADNALFPYGPDDQVSVGRAVNGPLTLFRLQTPQGRVEVWEPFAAQPTESFWYRRNLYKNPLGNRLIFEEVNESLGLSFRYRWAFSEKFGLVRSCQIKNVGVEPCAMELLDGFQNVLPYGMTQDFQMRYSNLANAYRKQELVDGSNLGLFMLSSIPTDRAEPSESLKATTVWQTGLKPSAILLSSEQVSGFRTGQPLSTETDVRGKPGAFLVQDQLELGPGESRSWHMVAELSQDHSNVIALDDCLKYASDLAMEIEDDLDACQRDLVRIISSSDAIQCSSNERRANRHLSNTVFNVMRGGLPLNDYRISKDDFRRHVANFNRDVTTKHADWLDAMPDVQTADELISRVEDVNDPDLRRLAMEYLPLAFSRRHGDPTRPWNHFSICLRSKDGSSNLNYQGNWRDIFQNWEALAVSFPNFSTAMISRFVNATTADGYNPYRITKDGIEWEVPTPDDPWANIGYWGDHQIIYLQKLLELNRGFSPTQLTSFLNRPAFVHANIPYRIKSYEAMQDDFRSTIVFDAEESERIEQRVNRIGADGKLLAGSDDQIHYVTLMEKLLTLSLAKMSNFVPDGGIWLNTQRPEWNDANNALVGNGLSVVTACYLHRWFQFLENWLQSCPDEAFGISTEVVTLFDRVFRVLADHEGNLPNAFHGSGRKSVMDELSQAGSEYRESLYQVGLQGQSVERSKSQCMAFFQIARRYIAATIRNNRRDDGLYHAYNLLDFGEQSVEIEYLNEMLEGQVAVLSAGLLSSEEVVDLLNALKFSALYRDNQQSYLLYPDRSLPRFLEKNRISETQVESSGLLLQLLEDGDETIINRDRLGGFHFNGQFRNSADLENAIQALGDDYESLVQAHGGDLKRLFEQVFEHKKFTGRSGTFFGYEGLGSIYWHMVSKLGLAVSENLFAAIENGASDDTVQSLRNHYDAIRRGIGAEKTPTEYGAFPTDPYSHTPENAGVKQPGMTGQVKEDVLARMAEVGVHVSDGKLQFRMDLFDREELLPEAGELCFYGLDGKHQVVDVPEGGLGFTLCQVPIVYRAGASDRIRVHGVDGSENVFDGLALDAATSRRLFDRGGSISKIECQFAALQ